jgi:predicted DNA-binding protein
MSAHTKQAMQTKTISLRIPIDFDEYLQQMALKTGRSKSNYIKFLIQQEKDRKWNKNIENMRKLGDKIFQNNGLDSSKMTDEEAYNFFKNI